MNDVLSKILKAASQVGVQLAPNFIPGGALVQKGLNDLLNKTDRDGDGKPDIEEAILDVVLGSAEGAEAITRQDIVNDPVLKMLGENIIRDIELFRHVLVERHGSKVAQ